MTKGKKHQATKYLKQRKKERARHNTKKLQHRKLEEKIAKPSLARQAFADIEPSPEDIRGFGD